MTDDEIINSLKTERPTRNAVQTAVLLDQLLHHGISQGAMITFFKRAFPEIPLTILLGCGGWTRLSNGDLSDDDFNQRLAQWLPSNA